MIFPEILRAVWSNGLYQPESQTTARPRFIFIIAIYEFYDKKSRFIHHSLKSYFIKKTDRLPIHAHLMMLAGNSTRQILKKRHNPFD
jgi:predicted Rossmann-fold nucleotide-binding protein